MINSCSEDGFARKIPGEVNLKDVVLPVIDMKMTTDDKITSNSVDLESFIKSNGGAMVTKSGLCWGTNTNPSLEQDTFTTNGPIIGKIPGLITGLDYNTEYYARAYAINPKGINYSDEVTFKTKPKAEWTNFQDDFNREVLGAPWVIHSGNFELSKKTLIAKSSGYLLFENKDAITLSGNGNSFKIETIFKLHITSGNDFAGVIFNAENANKFYVLRIAGDGLVQFLATADGGKSWPGVFLSTNTPLIGLKIYLLQITSDTPGKFNITIKDGELIIFNEIVTDPIARYNGGFVGYYSEGPYSQFDNFSLSIK